MVDSAGIAVVTNTTGAMQAAPQWTLSPSPTYSLGTGANPAVPLFRIRAVTPLDGTRVAVSTLSPPQVRVFGPDGELSATAGGPGDGPGEFLSVSSVVALDGDSLAVWDPARRRISLFSTDDGTFLRDMDVSGLVPRSPEAAGSVSETAAFITLHRSGPDALVLFAVGVFGAEGPGVTRASATSVRISHRGEELQRFGPFPGEQLFMDAQMGFAPYRWAASTFGVARGDSLVVGTAEASELRIYGPDGALAGIVRWPDRDRALGGPRVDAFERWLERTLAEQPPDFRGVVELLLDRMPVPERFPAYAGLVSSEAGELWVGDYPGQLGLMGLSEERPRVPERAWLVLGTDGAVTATVRTPEGFQPHAVRAGHVWGVFTDGLDVESVRAYEVVRPG